MAGPPTFEGEKYLYPGWPSRLLHALRSGVGYCLLSLNVTFLVQAAGTHWQAAKIGGVRGGEPARNPHNPHHPRQPDPPAQPHLPGAPAALQHAP